MFKWTMTEEGRVLCFQLSSAHNWWLSSRRRQGRGALERDAIRSQLREAPYALEARLVEGIWMYGVDLVNAQELGLDVPAKVTVREVRFKF
jgi:hypothetical protein